MDFYVKKLDGFKVVEPNVVSDEADNFYVLQKEAYKKMHWLLGFSYQVSKKLYGMAPDLWRDLYKLKSTPSDETDGFDISNYYGLFHNNSLLAFLDSDITESLSNLDKFIHSYDSNDEYTNLSYRAYMNISPDNYDHNKEYIPIMTIDMNYYDGYYISYYGVYDGNITILNPTPLIESGDIEEFLAFDFGYEAKISAKLCDRLYESYDKDRASNLSISAREMLDIIKITDAIVETSDTGLVYNVVGISNPEKIIEFLNSFKVPYRSLKKMNYLRKSLKHNGISINSLMKIVYDTYRLDPNISSRLLAFVSNMYFSASDSQIVREEVDMD